MITNNRKLEKALFREAAKRTECPELRRDMIQQAWLDLLEKRTGGAEPQSDLALVVKSSVIPSMSKYFWKNRCVVSCSRPRKTKASVPVNVSDDFLMQSTTESDPILINPDRAEELYRRHYCEYQIGEEAQSILEPKEFEVIASRFLAEKKNTRGKIGRNIGVSAERVRQIELTALDKLRTKISFQA